MPYIGQRPATGEANSFKILDEISSFTLTFDGSSAGVVSVANDTITEREHRFVTGQRVTYNDGGGTAITGLSDGVYYVIVEDRHTFKLASSANNAASGTAINLTGVGVGASHTLNVAFDGVNTKFKATINNGTKAGISQSGQLMLSINGVLQEPHDNTDSPSTGYAADHTSTIIFSAAPASNDQFFGRLIASNAPTFDISDNVVDNFTGDGSTSTFTLSKTPPNNESVLVTIDGVVQYPDDTSAVRAYTVAENILSFVSAPGLAVEIQVRHIGFAGASSAGITGFYGRTGNAVLKSTDNIVLNNATASGTVQAANVTVTGDLTVNGTTTTLDTDLIGVDKLEVAANNTTVAAAITQTGTGDILSLYDGSTKVFEVADGGNVFIGGNIPSESSIELNANGNIVATGNLTIADRIKHKSDTNTAIRFPSNDTVTVETAGSERVRITSAGLVGIGSESPRYPLEVHGGNLLVSGSAAGNLILEDRAVADGSKPFTVLQSDGGYFNIYRSNRNASGTTTSSALALRVASDGKVRIGTAGGDTGILNIHAETDGNLCVRPIASVTGSSPAGSGVVLDVLNDASNTIKDIAFRGATTIFRNATGETLRVDSSGRLLVGTESEVTASNPSIQLVDSGTAILALARNDSSITAGNALGTIEIYGNDGGSYQMCASIAAQADGTHANDDKPTRLVFATTNDGASAPTEKLRIDSNGAVTVTTTGYSDQYSYSMKLGQGAYTPSGTTSPHYGLWVRQLGPRYALNYGVYSEIEDDSGFYAGATLDGLSSVRGVGVYGSSPTSASAYQKAIGVYGKATNADYNYNTTIGVRGRAEAGTTSFINNNGQKSYGGHFVATGKSNCIGVYADAFLAASPGASQEAIPLLVASNGSEKLRVTADGDVSISSAGTVHGVSKLTILPANRTSAFSASDGDTWHDVVLMQGGGGANSAVGIAFELEPGGDYHKNAGTGIAAVKNGTAQDYGSDLVFITRPQSAVAQERLRIASDGDLEYRYNDADTSTEVGATQVPHGFRILNQNNTLGRLAGITFAHGGGESANAGIFHETTNTANTSTAGLGDLTFWTKPSGASHIVERLRITSGGKIILKPGVDSGNILQLNGADTTSELFEAGITSGHVQLTATHASGGSNTCGFIFRTRGGGGGTTEKLRINSVGSIQHQASGGDNQFISKRTDAAGSNGNYFFHLRAQNSTPVDVGSLGFHRDTATDDSRFVISTRNTGGSNTERLRINSNGIVKFAGMSHARGYIDGGVVVGNSAYFDIASVYDGYVFVKILIEVGYTGNATYQMHAQYDYVTCNYYTTGSTATITGIAQIEAANAQFNYSDISITRPSNRTIRLTYAPSSGAGTHHPIISVSGVFDTLTTS